MFEGKDNLVVSLYFGDDKLLTLRSISLETFSCN